VRLDEARRICDAAGVVLARGTVYDLREALVKLQTTALLMIDELDPDTSGGLTVKRGQVERLLAAIRLHRDQRGDDRCHVDDATLYAVLPEGAPDPATLALPPRDVFLANCARFHACRQPPGVEPVQGPQGRWATAEEVALLDATKLVRGADTMGPIDAGALVKLAREAKGRATAAIAGPWAWEPTGEKSNDWCMGTVFPPHAGRIPDDYHPETGTYADKPEVVDFIAWGGDNSALADPDFIAHARTDVPTLADGVIALAEDNARLHTLLLRKAEPTFGPFSQTKDGLVELPVEDAMGVVRRVIDSLVTTLGDAKNYVAISGYHTAAGKIECIVQRVGKLSPHEAHVEAEQHLARAVKLLAEHGIAWEGPTTFLPSSTDRGAEIASEHTWLRIDLRTDPNAMVCERCGERQEMPRKGTAPVINGMLAAFAERHKDCREGDAEKLGRAPSSP